MARSKDWIVEAVKQMIVTCDLKMENYEMVSARGVLYELGYSSEDAEVVLAHIAHRGFSYCLDYSIPSDHFTDPTPKFPDQQFCYWGPDQLKDRLWVAA